MRNKRAPRPRLLPAHTPPAAGPGLHLPVPSWQRPRVPASSPSGTGTGHLHRTHLAPPSSPSAPSLGTSIHPRATIAGCLCPAHVPPSQVSPSPYPAQFPGISILPGHLCPAHVTIPGHPVPTCHHPRVSPTSPSSTIPVHLHPAHPASPIGISVLSMRHHPWASLCCPSATIPGHVILSTCHHPRAFPSCHHPWGLQGRAGPRPGATSLRAPPCPLFPCVPWL